MSKNELNKEIKIIQAFRKEVSSSKAKAVKSLEQAGICNSKGELKPQYK
jgi:hypothetical protein